MTKFSSKSDQHDEDMDIHVESRHFICRTVKDALDIFLNGTHHLEYV